MGRTTVKLILTGLLCFISSCQNKLTFILLPDELPDKPLVLRMDKDLDLWPVVKLSVNGEKVRLHLDTGGEADAISLTKEQIKRTSLRKIDKTKNTMMASGEKRKLHYYMADEVEVEGIRFTNCEIMEMPSTVGKFDNIGLIGWGFLRYFTVLIDFQNDLIKLYPAAFASQIKENDWQTINLDKNNRFKVRLAGYDKVFNAGFDTGALYINGEKGYNWIRVDQDKLIRTFDTKVEYDYHVLTSDLFTMDSVKIENQNFLIYETSQPDNTDLFLGYDFFSKHPVIIDYSGSKLYFR